MNRSLRLRLTFGSMFRAQFERNGLYGFHSISNYTISLVLFCISSALVAQQSAAQSTLRKPSNVFSHLRDDGTLGYSIELGEIEAGVTKIPILFHYTTRLGEGDGEFGAGWSVPIFNSRLEKTSESSVCHTSITGWRTNFDLHSDGKYRSRNRELELVIDGHEAVLTDGGLKFRYSYGRLKSFADSGGSEYRYRESRNGIDLIDGGRRRVVGYVKADGGMASSLWIGRDEFSLSYSKRPEFSDVGFGSVIRALPESLSGIKSVSVGKEIFNGEVLLLESGGYSHDFYRDGVFHGNFVIAPDGMLMSDETSIYSLSDGKDGEKIFKKKSLETGREVIEIVNNFRGISELVEEDGTRTVIRRILTAGGAYGKCVEIARYLPDGSISRMEKNGYTEGGHLLRRIIEGGEGERAVIVQKDGAWEFRDIKSGIRLYSK